MRFPATIAIPIVLFAVAAIAAEIPRDQRRSGFAFMGSDTQAMQNDDTANPGMLWVLDGETLWKKKAGGADKACADCHGDAAASMKGVAARYPVFDQTLGRPVNLEARINLCRAGQQQATPLPYEGRELLALTAFIGRQSRGSAIAPGNDPQLAPFTAKGRALFNQRQGQLNLACTNCHDENWDKRLAGSAITQGHPTGYPLYRLEWQDARLAAAPPARLPDRHPGATFRFRRSRAGRARTFPDVAGAGLADRDASGAALKARRCAAAMAALRGFAARPPCGAAGPAGIVGTT